AKVLCDLPLDVPVAADVGLADAEADEATALLTAAIGHWQALRGTSPDALRAEFLRRPGTLTVDDDGDWLLRVEGRGVDVLLDQLPWGTSVVALPWMSRLLRVEWR
ncbi:MAG TPA: contractile injection system tape measure protein, partial [Iamia sp.]